MISRFVASWRQRWLAAFLGWSLSFLISSLIPLQAQASNSHISGHVTDAVTNTPIAGISIDFYDQHGVYVASTTTDSNGDYSSPELYAADYYVRTSTGTNYQNELYGGEPCGYACSPSNQNQHIPVFGGNIVPLTSGATKTGINFELKRGGNISGKITDINTNELTPFQTVSIYDSAGMLIDRVTSADGSYTSNYILPTGSYFLFVEPWSGWTDYLSQTYDGKNCNGQCWNNRVTEGTAVNVTVGQQTTGINFKLTHSGTISGVVTSKDNGTPQSNVSIRVTDTVTLQQAAYTSTNSNGNYYIDHLAPGSYYVSAGGSFYPMANMGHDDQMVYDGISCPSYSCNLTQGTPVTVISGSITTNINFTTNTTPAPTYIPGIISGRVVDKMTGDPIINANLVIQSSDGNYDDMIWVDGTGNYISNPLPPGTYYVHTINYAGYLDVYFGGSIANNLLVWPPNTTPVTVNANQTTTGIDFELKKGGQIAGAISDGFSGRSLANITVNILDSKGQYVGWTWTDANGKFTAPASGALTSGDYHVRANPYQTYFPQAYGAEPCTNADCNNNIGSPIHIQDTGGITDISSLSLTRGGIISGKVKLKDTPPGAIIGEPAYGNYGPIYNNAVFFLRENEIVDFSGPYYGGKNIMPSMVDAFGRYYSHIALTGGTYYAEARNFDNYLGKRYENTNCVPHCKPNSGTSIAVATGKAANHIGFTLDAKGGTISGQITSQKYGSAIHGRIDVLDSNGDVVTSVFSDWDGRYTTTALPLGTYYLLASSDAWVPMVTITELYQNRPYAGSGGYQSGTPVTVDKVGTISNIDFALDEGFSIYGQIISEKTGLPLADGHIFVFDQDGLLVAKAQTFGGSYMTGNYSTPALPSGKYYVIAERDAYQSKAYGDLPVTATACVDDIHCRIDPANLKDATQITINGSSKGNINFVLAPGISKDEPVKGAVDNGGDGGGGAIVFETLALAILVRRLRVMRNA